MEMCRVCLTTEKGMHPLDETFVIQYNILTNLNISILDEMPQFTCESCLETVNYFKEFREKSIASEATLRQIICSKLKVEDINIVPKFEIKDVNNLQINENGLEKSIKSEIKEEIDVQCDAGADYFEVTFEECEDHTQNIIKEEHETLRLEGIKQRIKKRKKKIINKKSASTLIDQNHHHGNWICGLCPKVLKEEDDLNKHIDVHKDERQCELCKEKANSLSQLLAHRLAHVPPNQQRCHICNKRYRSCLYLEHHYRVAHIHQDDPKVTCKICLSSYVSAKKLTSHIFHVHSSVRYFCDVCSKGFSSKTNLKSHVKQHSMVKSLVCDLCGFTCNYSSGLKDHKIRRHSQKKFNCKNCSRPFASQQEYDRHKCKEKLKVCTICGLQLTGSSRLSRHMARHSNVAKYECDRCPAKYKSRAALTAHTNRHDGNRTQQCEFCPAKFYTATVLIKHRRIHTGEKPYVCKVCNKGFTGNHNLKVHMKVHGEYLIVKKNSEPDSTSITNIAKQR